MLDPSTVNDSSLSSAGLFGTGLRTDGTSRMRGNINMNTNLKKYLVDPTVASDAATKDYVDMKYYTPIGFTGIITTVTAISGNVICTSNITNSIICLQVLLYTAYGTENANSQLFLIYPSPFKQVVQCNSDLNINIVLVLPPFSAGQRTIAYEFKSPTLTYYSYKVLFFV